MYNLLTGYHQGTNRAVFLMLARPHVLQPTDYRTFVQGLRAIEGIQEFLLIVTRPEDIEGLCIEAFLETGHFPEDTPIIEPEEEYEEDYLDCLVTATAKGAGLFGSLNPWDKAECVRIEEDQSATQDVPTGWVVDKRQKRKRRPGLAVGSGWDDGHPGVADMGQADSSLPSNIKYKASDAKLMVSGKICGDSDYFSSGEDNEFRRTFRVFIRSEQPKKIHKEAHADIEHLLITSRGLCVCFKSGKDCPEAISPSLPQGPIVESIVDEPVIAINPALLTQDTTSRTRSPAMKEFLRRVQTAMTNSWRNPRRHAFGTVGFLESDYFKDQIQKLLPKDHLERQLAQIAGLPKKVVESFGKDWTVARALKMDLASFARTTGLSVADAAKARRQLLGLARDDDAPSTELKIYTQD
jgi:hypothetical protein